MSAGRPPTAASTTSRAYRVNLFGIPSASPGILTSEYYGVAYVAAVTLAGRLTVLRVCFPDERRGSAAHATGCRYSFAAGRPEQHCS